MLTIRLPEDIEMQLDFLRVVEHKSKTDVIQAAITEYLERHMSSVSAFELGKDLFGRFASSSSLQNRSTFGRGM
ncbi:MAG: ribbon-helix-helix domain-containing protein [Spirochaetales bacterium]|nr:ribbon-helix-helix domain-containing protein [Spirochaetales bacterium]